LDFADGAGVASCRMYGSGREAMAGFAKNLLEGVGSPVALAAFSALWFACFLLPWLAWPIAPAASAAGISANLLARALLSWRFGHGVVPVVFHPVSIVAFLVVAARSWGWSRRNAIRWRGRTYAARATREAS
jgi:hypothetical protein